MPPSTNRIEYKRELGDDLEQEAVAFLDSGGGDIIIGVCTAPARKRANLEKTPSLIPNAEP
ncbi:hypothetical protein FACS1894139_17670 [Planctomycetales bacterium]|nr:hypothetical protein FACS1894139_17670 [Planctomycetales bacterium]